MKEHRHQQVLTPGAVVTVKQLVAIEHETTVSLRKKPGFFAQAIEVPVGCVALVVSEPVNTQYDRSGRPSHAYYLVVCDGCVGWLSESYVEAQA